MVVSAKFPTFECIISNTNEEYDAEIEMFFLKKGELTADLKHLEMKDTEFASNYHKMMLYLRDLGTSIVELKEGPSYQDIVDLCMGPEIEDNVTDQVIKSKNETVPLLSKASLLVREIMFWYVRISKDKKFSRAFNPERFQGLPFVRLALTYRLVALVGRE